MPILRVLVRRSASSGRGPTETNALVSLVAVGDGGPTATGRHLRAAAAVQRAVGVHVWLVISVGCLCLVMLENGNLAEARAEVLPAVSGWLYGLREGAGGLWAP